MSGGVGGGGRGAEDQPGSHPFAPSALGTRQHWDTTYERELQAFQEYGDTGEIWFGEESMTRLIRWLEKQRVPLDASVLDIGTGNGVFLVELVEDFLNPTSELSKFGICVDKGTFDAISLHPDNATEKRKQYVKSLSRVLETGGFFLITSCNWTKDELLREFSEEGELTSKPPPSTLALNNEEEEEEEDEDDDTPLILVRSLFHLFSVGQSFPFLPSPGARGQ
ncbi:EEF1A lysine methyltransferase 2 isoform X5 [Tachyglossus aculeatus]|uniref:EEF1A lysine methyltransferase 2 isoform X5 n=1 Tax=Tachyglossus aculeatus TaxID=9261 RepID=UPI0018F5D7C2|nr:EEF1A lysine methyltransferase 2 isoform X5 [Tachyglossus aculeatus]